MTLNPEQQEAWDTVKKLAEMCCSEKHAEAMAQIDQILTQGMADTTRLNYLNHNFFHREMDDWDRRIRPEQTMWVTFGPQGVQGDIRRVIDAQTEKENWSED